MNPPGTPSQSPAHPNPSSSTSSQNSPGSSASRKPNRLGRYQVTGRLGKGGMGVVYAAEDTLLQRKVAIKLLPREVATNPEALRRFLREAQGAASLNHPNIVAIYDIGAEEGTYFIVMELMPGGSAQDHLNRRGSYSWREATTILRDVCRGVAAAHAAGLIHRDIKPANILRAGDGVMKLGDFGLVKSAGRRGTVVTGLGEVVGTPHYMSPEQSRSAAVDERSDIYSLGATYFTLLTGRPPFQGTDTFQVLFAHCSHPIPDPQDCVPDIPGQCTVIIRKAMAKNRGQRHRNARELLADLDQVLALEQEVSPVNSLPSPEQSPSRQEESHASPGETTHPLSLAEVYPAERTERIIQPQRNRWKFLASMLPVLAAATLLLAFLLRGWNQPRQEPTGTPVVEALDWPGLAVAAEKAIRQRKVPEMKRVVEQIQVLQNRKAEMGPEQQEALHQALARLEKARAFRESITEKGLVLTMDARVTGVAFSPNDRWLAASQIFGDGGAQLWDGQTGEKRQNLWPRRANVWVKVQALAFSHDSSVLAACTTDNGIRLWYAADGKESTLSLGTGVNRPLCVAFSPTSRTLVAGLEPFGTGKGKPYLKIWNLETGREPFAFKVEHSASVGAVAFSTAGQQVASGSQDQRVVLWNAETGRIWRELRTELNIQGIACDPRGRILAVAGDNPMGAWLQFWDYAATRMLAAKSSPLGSCRCVAFTRDGSLLASGSGATIRIWNPETQELLGTLVGHSEEVTSLAFSTEGGILASGSNDQTMRLWDVNRFLSPRP